MGGGEGVILWFSKHDGRLFKQVEGTLFFQVPKHLAGHFLKKAFFNQDPEAGLGCTRRWDSSPVRSHLTFL